MAVSNLQLDKKIPLVSLISFVGLFIIQTVVLVAIGASWKAQTEARLDAVEKSVVMFSAYMQRNDENTGRSIDKFARLEERFASMDSKLGDIRDQLILIKRTP